VREKLEGKPAMVLEGEQGNLTDSTDPFAPRNENASEGGHSENAPWVYKLPERSSRPVGIEDSW